MPTLTGCSGAVTAALCGGDAVDTSALSFLVRQSLLDREKEKRRKEEEVARRMAVQKEAAEAMDQSRLLFCFLRLWIRAFALAYGAFYRISHIFYVLWIQDSVFFCLHRFWQSPAW